MPRLINHSKFIVSWICHCKSKILCVAAKPRECWSMFKFFRKRFAIRGGDINCPASMMFTVTGSRADSENLLQRNACGELAFNNLPLIGETSECRNEQQRNTIMLCRRFKREPRSRSLRSELLFASVNIRPNRHQFRRLVEDSQTGFFAVGRWNSQLAQNLSDLFFVGFRFFCRHLNTKSRSQISIKPYHVADGGNAQEFETPVTT